MKIVDVVHNHLIEIILVVGRLAPQLSVLVNNLLEDFPKHVSSLLMSTLLYLMDGDVLKSHLELSHSGVVSDYLFGWDLLHINLLDLFPDLVWIHFAAILLIVGLLFLLNSISDAMLVLFILCAKLKTIELEESLHDLL